MTDLLFAILTTYSGGLIFMQWCFMAFIAIEFLVSFDDWECLKGTTVTLIDSPDMPDIITVSVDKYTDILGCDNGSITLNGLMSVESVPWQKPDDLAFSASRIITLELRSILLGCNNCKKFIKDLFMCGDHSPPTRIMAVPLPEPQAYWSIDFISKDVCPALSRSYEGGKITVTGTNEIKKEWIKNKSKKSLSAIYSDEIIQEPYIKNHDKDFTINDFHPDPPPEVMHFLDEIAEYPYNKARVAAENKIAATNNVNVDEAMKNMQSVAAELAKEKEDRIELIGVNDGDCVWSIRQIYSKGHVDRLLFLINLGLKRYEMFDGEIVEIYPPGSSKGEYRSFRKESIAHDYARHTPHRLDGGGYETVLQFGVDKDRGAFPVTVWYGG